MQTLSHPSLRPRCRVKVIKARKWSRIGTDKTAKKAFVSIVSAVPSGSLPNARLRPARRLDRIAHSVDRVIVLVLDQRRDIAGLRIGLVSVASKFVDRVYAPRVNDGLIAVDELDAILD